MSRNVKIDPASGTVSGTRTLRDSGNSTIITIPPDMVEALDLESGMEMELAGDWEEDEIRITWNDGDS